jgi:hypothetical protein
VDIWGRPMLWAWKTEAVREIFRGSRGGMWRKISSPVLETRWGDGRGTSTDAYKETKSCWAVSGVGGVHSTVRGQGTTKPGPREGTLLCSRNRRAEGDGDCRKAIHSTISPGRYRGSSAVRPSKVSWLPVGLLTPFKRPDSAIGMHALQ